MWVCISHKNEEKSVQIVGYENEHYQDSMIVSRSRMASPPHPNLSNEKMYGTFTLCDF